MAYDKTQYQTRKLAHDAISHIASKKRKHGMCVYECTDCGFYHISTIKLKAARSIVKQKYPIKWRETPVKEKKKEVTIPHVIIKSNGNSESKSTFKILSPEMARMLKGKIAAENKSNDL